MPPCMRSASFLEQSKVPLTTCMVQLSKAGCQPSPRTNGVSRENRSPPVNRSLASPTEKSSQLVGCKPKQVVAAGGKCSPGRRFQPCVRPPPGWDPAELARRSASSEERPAMHAASSPRSQLTHPPTSKAPPTSVGEPFVACPLSHKSTSKNGYYNPCRIAPVPAFAFARPSSTALQCNHSESSSSCISTSTGISFCNSSESFRSTTSGQVRQNMGPPKEKLIKPADDTSTPRASAVNSSVMSKAGTQLNNNGTVDGLGISMRETKRRTGRGDAAFSDPLSRSLSPSAMATIAAAREAAAVAGKVAAAAAARRCSSPASDYHSVRQASPRAASVSPRPSLAAARSTHKARVGAEERSKRFSVNIADRLHVVTENCTPRRR
eukprot:TRINITY_DN60582_c0_g1_i1.p1 TRINITY_DN60582_c0_g1~~TRINITY_DN60582_c0_g1_i1.p1  ORF type:complete len:389 (+),score=49.74 TRINITY_DN60582_c0_g1_i1:29-1168(+)